VVKSIYVSGDRQSGKSLIIYGLIRILMDRGVKATYFKPVSRALERIEDGWVDDDVRAIHDVLGLGHGYNMISPIVLRERFLEYADMEGEAIKSIMDAFKAVSSGANLVFIESFDGPHLLGTIGLEGFKVSQLLGSTILMVVKEGRDINIDEGLYWVKRFRDRGLSVPGLIVNFMPIHLYERLKSLLPDLLDRAGLKLYGLIPSIDEFTSPTLLDIATILGAEVITGDDLLEGVAGDILIGAMSPESALRWLRTARRPLIITGGDRTELLLMTLESGPSCLLLTGNLYPSIKVVTRAEEKGVPILLVPYDTYTTVEKLREIYGRITPESLRRKDRLIIDTLKKYVNIDELIEDLL